MIVRGERSRGLGGGSAAAGLSCPGRHILEGLLISLPQPARLGGEVPNPLQETAGFQALGGLPAVSIASSGVPQCYSGQNVFHLVLRLAVPHVPVSIEKVLGWF